MIPKKTPGPRRSAATEQALRVRGLRLTRPRRIILDVVRSTDVHPSASFVYRRVRRRLPSVSLATVYRNLRTLAAEGLLMERADASGLRFDGKTDPHDHFTCLRCGRIYDVPVSPNGGVRTRVAATTGFEVLNHRIEFYGRCGACRRRCGRTPTAGQRRRYGRQEP
ncbi:MAG: transcriptional repressor [Candidatus Rokubacteria bacterium]|nr:transcriptional repressor [Candidatus Rokubacteria bacterium]